MSDCGCQINGVRRFDPTRTLVLRDRFVREMNRRFSRFVKVVKDGLIVGLSPRQVILQSNVQPGQFDFPRSAERVRAFMDWLKTQSELYILSGGRQGIQTITIAGRSGSVENAWTSTYISSAYQQGIKRGREELRKAGADIPDFGDSSGLGRDPIQVTFNQPFHADRVGLVYSRTYTGLVGITDAMQNQIAQVLAQGMADGKSPRELAKILERVVTGAGGDLAIVDSLGRFISAKVRAEMLARTEIIRAHHQANIQEYINAGIEGVTVMAEWLTAGDSRVCSICAGFSGKTFTIAQISPMIPAHPRCRCVALPVVVP